MANLSLQANASPHFSVTLRRAAMNETTHRHLTVIGTTQHQQRSRFMIDPPTIHRSVEMKKKISLVWFRFPASSPPTRARNQSHHFRSVRRILPVVRATPAETATEGVEEDAVSGFVLFFIYLWWYSLSFLC